MLEASAGLSPALLPLRMEGFCAKILSLLILAHSDILLVWAPDKPHCGQLDGCHQGKPLITAGHFLSQATDTRTVSTWARESRSNQN